MRPNLGHAVVALVLYHWLCMVLHLLPWPELSIACSVWQSNSVVISLLVTHVSVVVLYLLCRWTCSVVDTDISIDLTKQCTIHPTQTAVTIKKLPTNSRSVAQLEGDPPLIRNTVGLD
ncbi:hypothetical protein J3F83DRAFT_753099, partial [Trichoderma novae-zelandiae]